MLRIIIMVPQQEPLQCIRNTTVATIRTRMHTSHRTWVWANKVLVAWASMDSCRLPLAWSIILCSSNRNSRLGHRITISWVDLRAELVACIKPRVGIRDSI